MTQDFEEGSGELARRFGGRSVLCYVTQLLVAAASFEEEVLVSSTADEVS